MDEWGGPGDGPGEFRRLAWMGNMGDTIVTLDTGLRRETRFASDGSVLDSRGYDVPAPVGPYLYGGWVFPTRNRDLITFKDVPSSIDATEADLAGVGWELVDAGGTVVDRLLPYDPADRFAEIDVGGGSINFERVLHRADRFAMSTDGSLFVVAAGGEDAGSALHVYDAARREMSRVDLDVPPVEVDERYAEEATRARLETWLSFPPDEIRGDIDAPARSDLAPAFRVAGTVPPVDEMFVTSEGEIWLREPNQGRSTDRWRVVNRDGEMIAEAEVPAGVVLRDRHGDLLWGYRLHPELLYPTLVRLRLERSR